MFSSNQILQVSGTLDDDALERALDFAVQLFNREKQDKSWQSNIVFQTVENKYYIGWMYKDVPKGWERLPFSYDAKILALIIRQYIERRPKAESEYSYYDGSEEKGFLMQCITDKDFNDEVLSEPFYGIVSFEPFTCFYAK